MEDADPETQALIRKLHREMNGLGRRAATAAGGLFDSDEPPKRAARDRGGGDKAEGRKNQREGGGHDRDGRGGGEERGAQKEQRRREGDKDRDGGHRKEKETGEGQQRDKSKQRGETGKQQQHGGSHKAKAGNRDDRDSRKRSHEQQLGHKAEPSRHKLEKKRSKVTGAELPGPSGKPAPATAAQLLNRSASTDSGCSFARQNATAARNGGEAGPSTSKGVKQVPDQPAVTVADAGNGRSRSHASAATIAADKLVKQVAEAGKQARRPPYGEFGRIKCFHAAVRWGLTVPVEALSSRDSLASALNMALSPHGLPKAQADDLHVLFIDAQGRTTEHPPLREGTKGGEGGAQADEGAATCWEESSRQAVRIYVR